MSQPQYKFYPSLLDAFVWYKKSEKDTAEQEFIDKVNRVPVTDEKALERMNKGTAFNELVDQFSQNQIQAVGAIKATLKNGFSTEFDANIVNQVSALLYDSTPQTYTECIITVNGVKVMLYGYIDYVRENICIDLKTTSSYELGKYKDSIQRILYPYSLNSEGINVDTFEFIVTDFESIFSETYPVDMEECLVELQNICAELISFLEAKKHLITDKKIFALDEVGV